MILIYPPSAKPSEPPAGLARLSGALGRHGVPHTVLDLNIEAQLWLLRKGRPASSDTWTTRAYRNVERNIRSLRGRATYDNIDRYSRAVNDLNRVLQTSARAVERGVSVGLANYQHETLSPVRSADLIAAAEGYEDNPLYPLFSQRISQAVESGGARVAGISVNFLNQALTAFAIAGFVRARYPHMKIVMGGGLVTTWLSSPRWSDPFSGLVDAMVAGPGEGAVLSLMGVGPGASGHVRPDYSGFPLAEYLSPGFVLPYSGSSGCWWGKCSFCPERAEGSSFVNVPAAEAVADLHAIVLEHRPSLIHLLDNAVSPALLRALGEDPPGVPWYGFARITEDLADDDYCAMLRRSGCVMLKLGLESGDQGVLDAMNKGIDLETASRALGALRRAGIATYVYLLFGTPPEGEDEARRTLGFVREHADDIGFLNLAVFNMPAYGPEAEGFGAGRFSEGDLSLYCDFEHPHGWDRAAVRRFLDEFRRDPAVAPIIRRMPPLFTSNHAAFFVL